MHDYQILKLWKVQVFFHILLFIVGIFNLSLSVVYCCQTDTWAWALSLSTNQRQGSITADQSEFDKSWWPTAVVVIKSRNDGSFLIILFLGGTKITTLVKIIKSIIIICLKDTCIIIPLWTYVKKHFWYCFLLMRLILGSFSKMKNTSKFCNLISVNVLRCACV